MTDHGEQPKGVLRTPDQGGGMGRSFADAWLAEPPAADPTAVPAGLEPASMAEMPSADNATSAGRMVTVKVSRPAQSGSSASGAAHMGTDEGVTVEIRRAGTAPDPSAPQEQVVVTVSLNHADEQITVTL